MALLIAVVGAVAWGLPPEPPGGARSAAPFRDKRPTCGTQVRFEESAEAAFARAQREDKLVLLLHLSGDFSSPEKT